MKYILWLCTVFLTIFGIVSFASAQVYNNYWLYSAGTLKPVLGSWSITVPQLGGSGTLCLHTNNAGLISTSSADCGTGSGFPFTTTSYGVSTSTTIGFGNGILSLASSTFTGVTFLNGGASTTQMSVSDRIYLAGVTAPAAPASGSLELYGVTTQGITRPAYQDGCSEVTLGRDSVIIARNTSAGILSQGDVVGITGSTGNVPNIAKETGTSGSTGTAADGVVLGGIGATTIGVNNYGCVMKLGIIGSQNTSAFASNDMLYLSTTTPGGIVNYPPAWPDTADMVGVVLVSGIGNGSILYHLTSGVHNQDTGTVKSSFGIGGFGGGTRSLIFANGQATSTLTVNPNTNNFNFNGNASTTGFTNSGATFLTGLTANTLLSLDNNKQVVSSSTIGNNQLQNSSFVVTTVAPLGGAGTYSLGQTIPLTCTGCLTGNQTITLTNDVTGSGATSIPASLAMGNSHWWTALQNFGLASTSQITATSSIVASYLTAGQLVATDGNDKLVSTSTIGSNQLQTTGVAAGSYTNTNLTVGADGRITTAANGSATGLGYIPWGGSLATNFGTTTIASTTPAWFQMGLQASSTSQFVYASTTALTVSSLTSGRVTFAGAGGFLTDNANLTYNGTTLSNSGNNSAFSASTVNTGFAFNAGGTSGLTSGSAFVAGGSSGGGISAFTGKILDISPVRNNGNATPIVDTGNFISTIRSNIASSGSFNNSGDLVVLSSNCTQSGASCFDASSVLSITQLFSSATGTVLKLRNFGSGSLATFSGGGTFGIGSTTPWGRLSVEGVSLGTTPLLSISTSTASATTTVFQIDSNGNTTIGNNGSVLTVNGATTTHVSGIKAPCFSVDGTNCITGGGSSASTTLYADNNIFTGSDIFNGSLSLGVNTNGLLLGGNVLGYASSTNQDTIFGIGAGGNAATTSNAVNSMTAIGYLSLPVNNSSSNTAVGFRSGYNNTSGSGNSILGASALFNNVTGSNNTAIGSSAMLGVTGNSHTDNTAVGNSALSGITTGFANVAVGFQSGYVNTSGYDNIYIGHTQNVGGNQITTGGGNILMGYNATSPSASQNLFLNIGNSIFGTLVATSTSTSLPTSMTGIAFGIATSSLTGNTFSVQNAVNTNNIAKFFSSTGVPRASISDAGVLTLVPLGTPAGTFLAADPSGNIIATSTPATGSGTVTSIAFGDALNGGTITTSGSVNLKSYFATSTPDTTGYLMYSGSTNGWPAKVAYVATSTLSASSPLTGSFIQIGSGGSLGIQAASNSQNGYLAAADFSLLHAATSTFTAPLVWTAGTNAVTCTAATISVAGCIQPIDWSRFNSATTTAGSTLTYTASTNSFNINLGNANTWTALQTMANTGTTTFAGGIESPRIEGAMISATSSLWANDGRVYSKQDKAFTIASSTLAYSGWPTATSSYMLWNPQRAVTITDLYCKTYLGTAGTTTLEVGSGTATSTVICGSGTPTASATGLSISIAARGNVYFNFGNGSGGAFYFTPTLSYTSN